MRIIDGRVVIDAVASADVSALQADLEALGMHGAVAAGRIVSGQLPIFAIDALAALASLQFVRPAYASTHVGLVTSQGDQAMRSDVARANFGVNGAGVTVGVLSDSFNCLGGAAADVANNDLSPVAVLQDDPGCSSGTDEGRAMLQLVHDVAPGADLAFATAFTGQAGFASNILALHAAGADVIVDDVLFFAEPMFQDGIIAQAVNTVVGMGVPYFSSAGNQARRAYQSAFNPGPVLAVAASRRLPVPLPSLAVRPTTSTLAPGSISASRSRSPRTLASPSPSNGTRRFSPSAARPAHPTIWTFTCSTRVARRSWPGATPSTWAGTRWRSLGSRPGGPALPATS